MRTDWVGVTYVRLPGESGSSPMSFVIHVYPSRACAGERKPKITKGTSVGVSAPTWGPEYGKKSFR